MKDRRGRRRSKKNLIGREEEREGIRVIGKKDPFSEMVQFEDSITEGTVGGSPCARRQGALTALDHSDGKGGQSS